MTKLEAVIFDLDGTLLDSAHDLTQAINKMLAEEGRPPLTVDEIKPMLGDGAMELCQRVLEATGGCTADDLFPYVQKFIGHYRQIDPDPAQVFSGVRELLEELKAKEIKMGVCTNKADQSTHAILNALDLSKYFGFIAGGDTFMVHKPNPGHVTGVLDELGVGTEGALFLGDGPADVVACQKAKVPCIVMTQGYGENFDELEADAFAADFSEVPAVIQKLGFCF